VTRHRTLAVREILAATDFSTRSSQSFDAALALAQHFGARLHVLHAAADASEQQIAQGKLESLASEQGEDVAIVTAVPLGQAAPEIAKYALREKIDLIVLGTHGRSGFARVLMGSVAEAVVRTAPCQVLTIGPKAHTIEEAVPAVQAIAEIRSGHCLVCAKPSELTICDACQAHIQGEAIERKRRAEQPGHRGLAI
jgi:nucleotide-binding universal stress UspA family protein